MHMFRSLCLAGVAYATGVSSSSKPDNFTVALVRAPPANYPYPQPSLDWKGLKHDLNASVELGIQYIEQAASQGADLIAFPELWFPGYPTGVLEGNISVAWYADQSLRINSTQWDQLVEAARQNKVWVALGFSMREDDYIYMSQALINSTGKVIQIRRKLRPSGGERTMFSDGTVDEFKVFQTQFGRLGLLECWEHMHPPMTFAMQSQNENLHIAAFPFTPDFGADTSLESTENSMTGARYYAITGQTWTFMPSVGTAAVFSPNGTIVAQIEATEEYPARPILYYSVNTTGFSSTPAYNVNGEFSWSQMEQIGETYPDYIPHVMGNFTPRRLNSVEQMKKTGPIPLNY